ncbi:MAG: uroporphyrinogen-III synthase [Rickettsiales bacterium]
MRKSLWVPRPATSGFSTALRMARVYGVACYVEPLLARRVIDGAVDRVAEQKDDALFLVSSRYVFDALCSRHALLTRRYLCVGERSAAYAQNLGFSRASFGGTDAISLCDLALTLPQGDVVYVSAEAPRLNVDAKLRQFGINATSVALYRTEKAKEISRAGKFLLKNRLIGAVALYSVAMAEAWTETTEGQSDALRVLPHVCISEAVAKRVVDMHGERVILIADAPTAEATERVAARAMSIYLLHNPLGRGE